MTVAAIIAEYNPFHNGHEYHIRKTKELTGADFVAVILSGGFVQRSEPAMFSKKARVDTALAMGADIVVEMPSRCVLQSAQNYARCGVTLANALGADFLSFGSECGDIYALKKCADILAKKETSDKIKEEMGKGISYPNALRRAVLLSSEECAAILDEPNNVLAIEYIKAIIENGFSITPVTVKRSGAEHDSCSSEGGFASASLIRSCILNGIDFSQYMPEKVYGIIKDEIEKGEIMDYAMFNRALLSDIRRKSPADITEIRDVKEGIEYKIISEAAVCKTLDELIDAAKSKRYTHSRLRRIIICSLLGLEGSSHPEYLRLLGLRKTASECWKKIKNTSAMYVIEKAAKTDDYIIKPQIYSDIKIDGSTYGFYKNPIGYDFEYKDFPIIY